MKLLVNIAVLLIMHDSCLCQTRQAPNDLLKVEWKKELAGPDVGVSGLLLSDQKICITQTGETSIFKILDLNGIIVFNAFVDKMRIRSLQKVNESIFTIGDHHLSRRNQKGPIESEKKLYWIDNSWIHMVNGEIYNGKLYTTNSSRDLVIFDLDGNQLIRKQLGTTVINQLLQAKSEHIYLYSIFQDPSHGPRLMLYDTVGNLKWSITPSIHVIDMSADKAGNIYLMGGTGGKCFVQKYDIEGKLVWSTPTEGISYLNGKVYGDSLIVCGGVTTEKPYDKVTDDDRQGAWAIYSVKTGERIYSQTFNLYPGEGNPERFRQIAYDQKTGNVYLGGSYGQEGNGHVCILVKLSREGNTTGLNDDKNPRTSFNIFPNPGGTRFTITCENNETRSVKVTVRNLTGQVVYSKEISCNTDKSFTLDLGKQSTGNYSVEVGEGADKVVKKIIVE